ncbi:MAG TPA: MotA/TolQ/ExbB proton channel family protein [Planctomycetaceae bacterium]|nr:MotA/TolQ/ExbB proton channel family protein [Planctomycetaceae bacterium]
MSVCVRRCAAVVWSWGLLLAVLSLPVSLPVSALAQADDAATDAAAAPAAPAAPAAEGAAAPKQSTLMWLIHTSGWIGGVLLLMSFYFVAQVVQLFLELRTEVVMPPALIQQWDELLAKRDFQGIYRTAKENTSELGQLVAAGLAALSSGLGEARETVDRVGETVVVDMEKRISMLAVIGSLGPLIGLLGTLKGMIASFSVIAMSETQLKASEVAGGISEALLITFEGVALSVPAIFLFAVFKNRVSTLSLQAITMADEFIRRVHTTAQSRTAAPTSNPPA